MFSSLLTLPPLQQGILIYVVGINLVTFFYFGIDKLKSQLSHRRISEKMLWTLSLLGGSLGGLVAMSFFRHKTKKLSFQAGMAIILVVQLGIAFLTKDW